MSNNKFKEELKHHPISHDIENLKAFDPNFIPKYDENGNLMNHPAMEIVDDYFNVRNNDFTIEYFKMIVSAIYLEYRRLYPGLDIIISFREKGERSLQKNADRTLRKQNINSISAWQKDIHKDILGMKIIFNRLPDELPFEYNSETAEIMKLNEKRLDNQMFSNVLKKWIQGYSEELQDEETFYAYKIDLLSRLKDCSYDSFTDDKNAKNPFLIQLEEAYKEKALKESDGFAFEVKKSQLNELEDLRLELVNRLNEKLENAIIDITLPRVLETDLVNKELSITSYRDPSPSKENGWIRKSTGYVALYYSLIGSLRNPSSKDIEIEFQANSERTHNIDSIDHNDIPGKKVDIYNDFFELKDPNDEHNLKYYLDILDKIEAVAAYSRESQYRIPKRKALAALEHIKLKKSPKDDEALWNFAEYASPWLYTTHSAHNKAIPTVLIEKKKLSENFADILRKNDGISVLAHMLIERIEELENEKNISSEENITITRILIRKFIEKYKNRTLSDNSQR